MVKIIPVDPFDYVVFGALGDLAKRKLFPALASRDADGQIPGDARIIGSGRRDLTHEAFRAEVYEACKKFMDASQIDQTVWDRFLGRLFYQQIDVTTADGYQELAQTLGQATKERPQVFYLALAPAFYADTAKFLAQAGLNGPHTRLVLEKPLGKDLTSSRKINEQVGQYFAERQIYRIDHYLGKESVQNLLALRFGNMMFERIWNSDNIDHVQITAAETVGLGSRVSYYDTAGALRDMVQNHLLQLMCLTAMEPPSVYEADAIRDEKRKVLKALRPIGPAEVATKTVRGQYGPGAVDGQVADGYVQELGEGSDTETFVAIEAEIDNWRWAGVPFYLRTGKSLAARYTEIVIQFKSVPHSMFAEEDRALPGNRLIIRLQPDEGVRLNLMTKDPGPGGMRLRDASLDLSFAEEFEVSRFPDAYERLLLDVVRGNTTLFMRNDEVEAAWAWIDPILAAWTSENCPVEPYAAGTMGPTRADLLLALAQRQWHEELLA